jgi:hypothetical protein
VSGISSKKQVLYSRQRFEADLSNSCCEANIAKNAHISDISLCEDGNLRSSERSPWVKSMEAPTPSDPMTPPVLPSLLQSPFAPRPCETQSLRLRSGAASQHPVGALNENLLPQSSGANLRGSLLRQREAFERRSPCLVDLPTSMPSLSPRPIKATMFVGQKFVGHDYLTPTSSPFTSSQNTPSSATFPSYDIPRAIPQQSNFGAIGQTPPSGQGG